MVSTNSKDDLERKLTAEDTDLVNRNNISGMSANQIEIVPNKTAYFEKKELCSKEFCESLISVKTNNIQYAYVVCTQLGEEAEENVQCNISHSSDKEEPNEEKVFSMGRVCFNMCLILFIFLVLVAMTSTPSRDPHISSPLLEKVYHYIMTFSFFIDPTSNHTIFYENCSLNFTRCGHDYWASCRSSGKIRHCYITVRPSGSGNNTVRTTRHENIENWPVLPDNSDEYSCVEQCCSSYMEYGSDSDHRQTFPSNSNFIQSFNGMWGREYQPLSPDPSPSSH